MQLHGIERGSIHKIYNETGAYTIKVVADLTKSRSCDKYLSNIERATSVLSIDVLMKLCSVLETTPDALLLGTANDENDYQRSMSSRLRQMSSKQARLTLSLMDWILSQKLE